MSIVTYGERSEENAISTSTKLVYAEPIEHPDDRGQLIAEAVEIAMWAALTYHVPFYIWEYNGCIFAGAACPDWDDALLIHSVASMPICI
jgi:hypothetical protein